MSVNDVRIVFFGGELRMHLHENGNECTTEVSFTDNSVFRPVVGNMTW